jgi:hypothetical protein
MALRNQARDLYTALQRVDKDRKGRYLDMGKSWLSREGRS